jgi:hypothetical protein
MSAVLQEEDHDFEIETTGVNGNPNLKPAGTTIEWQPWQIEEYMKCAEDPIYFCEKYVKIISLDEGVVNFRMFEFQKRFVRAAKQNRFTIVRCGRQMGKTTTATGLLLHEGLFSPNSFIAILANKMDTAQEILDRIQMAYENLPMWLQQGVIAWNKRSFALENGTKFICAPTSSSAIRGKSISTLYLDEFAHIPPHIQLKFFTATYPVISSGKNTKIIITSTPNGMELYYKLWTDAVKKRNSYVAVDVHWSEYPGRDENWKQETINNTSPEQFRQEYEVEFLGSSNTLLSAECLQRLTYEDPISVHGSTKIYSLPDLEHRYVMTADVARGVGGDYSAFIVIDVTQFPYKVAAIYRDNSVEPQLFPHFINEAHKFYNNCPVLVETNDIGQQIAEMLITDFENEGILRVTQTGRKGQVLGGGFNKQSRVGLKTTQATKRVGCLNMKALIENNKLTINDYDLLSELSTFISKGTSYEAEFGKHDDLVMCLVLFAWMTNQNYFKDLLESDVRKNLMEERERELEDDMLPFFSDDGMNAEDDFHTSAFDRELFF